MILGTNLSVTWCILNSFVRTHWYVHNQFPPPQEFREWSDVDPEGQALEVVQQFQELYSFWASLCVCHHQLMCDLS